MFRIFILFLAFMLPACDNAGNENQAAPDLAASKSDPQADKPAPAAPTTEELDLADKIVAFANRAKEALDNGHYSLPDVLAANTRHYQQTWRLPARPKRPERNDYIFMPPEGLFNEQEAVDLQKAFAGMDKAMNNLFGHYANLEKYVADQTIRDDGKKGKDLSDRIEKAHTQYMAARKTWLEIVNKRAMAAEKILLAGHPLERQMQAALNILAQFREVSSILASGSPQQQMLAACRQIIQEQMALGAKPPFPASPRLERPYREFLKQVEDYVTKLSTGIAEGFHSLQTRQLNDALARCQKSYNEFVEAANSPQPAAKR